MIALHKQYVEKYGIPIHDIHLGSQSSTILDVSENDASSSPSTYRSTVTGHHHLSTMSEQALPKMPLNVSPTSSTKDTPSPTSNGMVSNKVPTNNMTNPVLQHQQQQSQRVKPSKSFEDNIHRTATKESIATPNSATNTTTATTITKDIDNKSWSGGGAKGITLKEKKKEHLENAFGDLYSNQFFTQNFKSSLSTTPEQNPPSMDSGGDMKFEDYLFKTKSSSTTTTTTNVDAFEASFNTSFPSSFSANSMMTSSSSMDLAFDVPGFSDPFFLGASSPVGGSSNHHNNTVKNINTSARIFSQQDLASATSTTNKLSIPYTESVAAKRKPLDKVTTATNAAAISITTSSSSETNSDKRSQELFPLSALNMFESLSVSENSSKSHRGRSLASKDLNSKGSSTQQELSTPTSTSNQPPPPPPTIPSPQIIDAKINVAASRARFDSVKGNRNDTVDPVLERKAQAYELSPTRVDQRTHSSSRRNYNIRESDVNDEFGKLDEIVANASISSPVQKDVDPSMDSTANNGQRSRRSVRQPVSYTEPSLNTKMRRGDVYFQKQEDELEPSQLRIPRLDMRR